jgi:hypothetical protein
MRRRAALALACGAFLLGSAHAEEASTPPACGLDGRCTEAPVAPDLHGAARDAGYFIGYQVAVLGALVVLPEKITGVSPEDKRHAFEQWRYNVSHPTWDHDAWAVNYLLHPYWGGAYYTRARERGLDGTQAFWYAALLSTFWEYGTEALSEPVSIQDMIVTPVAGSLVGEFLFRPWRERILAQPEALSWPDRAALVLTDPIGAMNETVDRWLGTKTTLQWRTVAALPAAGGSGSPTVGTLEVPRRAPGRWGLELHLIW